eukprot:scaffold11486_cov170-Ochromonas_danica.AAC.3
MDSHLGPNCEAVVQYIASLARERSLRYLLSLGLAYGSNTGSPPLSEAMLSTIASVEGLHLTKLCLWTSSVSMSGLLQFYKKMTGLKEKLSRVYIFFFEGNRAISDNRGFLPDIGKLWDLNPQFLHLTVQGCLDLERRKQPLCQCTLDLIAAYSPNDAS